MKEFVVQVFYEVTTENKLRDLADLFKLFYRTSLVRSEDVCFCFFSLQYMMKTNSLKKQNEEFQDSFEKVRNKYSELILYYLLFGSFSLF